MHLWERVHYVCNYANVNWGLTTLHNSQPCRYTHTRDMCEVQSWRGIGREWAQIPWHVSLSLSLSYILSRSFSPLCPHSLSFPLCQPQRASLLFRVGNATGAKSVLLSVWYHPVFVPAVSCHRVHGFRLQQPREKEARRTDLMVSGTSDLKFSSKFHLG